MTRILLVVPASALALLEVGDATRRLRHPDPSSFGDLLLAGAGWVLVGCAAWALVLVVAAGVEAVSVGRICPTRWLPCPARLRRGLLVLVGSAAVATTIGTPALAGVGRGPDPAAVSGLPAPARPSGKAPGADGPGGRSPREGHQVVVRPGDSLWHLVGRGMPGAADPAVADAVQETYRKNRAVIGADPDHIEPGQRLTLPPPTTSEEDR